ncbi:MAG: hypothetical protein JEZ06_00450 [Anaerolineaceae bacterium]|nr:hypothetical protein [Anaerolineaceae bacterium]
MLNLSYGSQRSIQSLKAADNETLTGSGVDMLGFESVMFIAGALKGEALDFAMKAQQDIESAFGTAADLEGSSDAFSTTVYVDGLASLDIHQPQERYVRPVITVPNAAAATPVFCIAIKYNPKNYPVSSQGGAFEQHVSPDEGTA